MNIKKVSLITLTTILFAGNICLFSMKKSKPAKYPKKVEMIRVGFVKKVRPFRVYIRLLGGRDVFHYIEDIEVYGKKGAFSRLTEGAWVLVEKISCTRGRRKRSEWRIKKRLKLNFKKGDILRALVCSKCGYEERKAGGKGFRAIVAFKLDNVDVPINCPDNFAVSHSFNKIIPNKTFVRVKIISVGQPYEIIGEIIEILPEEKDGLEEERTTFVKEDILGIEPEEREAEEVKKTEMRIGPKSFKVFPWMK